MKKSFILVAALLVAVTGFSQDVRPTDKYGATHVVIVDFNDFAETLTNTAETLTFAVAADTAVEMVAMELVTAFDTADTNYTGSFAVSVGDGSDADLYLTSTELASDGTEVFWKFGASASTTVTVTPTTTNLVTEVGSAADNTDLQTNALVTAISASYAGGGLGRKVYTSADTIDFLFTPNAEEATSDNVSGEVYFFIKMYQ